MYSMNKNHSQFYLKFLPSYLLNKSWWAPFTPLLYFLLSKCFICSKNNTWLKAITQFLSKWLILDPTLSVSHPSKSLSIETLILKIFPIKLVLMKVFCKCMWVSDYQISVLRYPARSQLWAGAVSLWDEIWASPALGTSFGQRGCKPESWGGGIWATNGQD